MSRLSSAALRNLLNEASPKWVQRYCATEDLASIACGDANARLERMACELGEELYAARKVVAAAKAVREHLPDHVGKALDAYTQQTRGK